MVPYSFEDLDTTSGRVNLRNKSPAADRLKIKAMVGGPIAFREIQRGLSSLVNGVDVDTVVDQELENFG